MEERNYRKKDRKKKKEKKKVKRKKERKIESKSGKTHISAPAHPSTTDGRVSGLVFFSLYLNEPTFKMFSVSKLTPFSFFPISLPPPLFARIVVFNQRAINNKPEELYLDIRRLEASKLSSGNDFYCADTEINWRVSLKDHLKLTKAGMFPNLQHMISSITF